MRVDRSRSRWLAIANGSAHPIDVERFGQHWLDSLVDLAERGSVGSLEHREDGAIVFQPAARVPDADEAWRRANAAYAGGLASVRVTLTRREAFLFAAPKT
jgi:hypothetical protein